MIDRYEYTQRMFRNASAELLRGKKIVIVFSSSVVAEKMAKKFFGYMIDQVGLDAGWSQVSQSECESDQGGSVKFINGFADHRGDESLRNRDQFVIDDYYPSPGGLSERQKINRERLLARSRGLSLGLIGSDWVSQGSSDRVKIKQPNSATGMVSGEIPEREVNGSP